MHLLNAQVEIPFKYKDLAFEEYLTLVKANNLKYAAEKLNVNISESAIEAAKIFNDPYISAEWTQDRENNSVTGHEYYSEIGKTIELSGKRNARIDLSLSENKLSEAILADYFRNLRAEATQAYLEGMKQKQLFMVRYNSYQTMKKLHEADSIRLNLGSIMQIDAIQSNLEAGILYNQLLQAIAEWKNSLAYIAFMTGISHRDTLLQPASHLHNVSRDFSLDILITTALNNRADLVAALLNKEVSQKSLILAKKERKTDLDLKFGLSNSFYAGSSTKTSGITAGIAVPLKFSNFYKGDIHMAQFKIQQAEELFKEAELQLKTEISKAWELYQGYCKQVENFDNGLLKNAENVRIGKIYSYQRGETSLLEVLNAQRTFNEIQTTYYETLFNRAAALIEMEKAAGIWDINF